MTKKVVITEEQLCNLMGGRTVKDVVTGLDVKKGQFIYDWQNFINARQEDLLGKLNEESASNSYLSANHQLFTILNDIAAGDDTILHKILNAVDDQQKTVSSLSYMKGLMEGIKLASTVGGL